MSYTVLARRYRSRDFGELVGQNAVAKTLQTAIAEDRVAHAYLFTGTRGVGKTSTARIFANALNNPKGDQAITDAIMQGRDTDVIEIDAASNSKVEEARELIANAVYRPMRGIKKIYIIDECHMLSTAAFNALLKTMEEPPAHVVFILCTTETHKVPATIQSRCQRFDFRNIPTAEIARHLGAVLKEEKREATPELLHAVARLAAGSMRDALSLMDRLLAGTDKKLTVPMLEELLGLPEAQLVSTVIDAVAAGDAGAALKAAGRLLGRGTSGDTLLGSMAERFRDLLVIAQCGPDPELLDLPPEVLAEAEAQARKFDPAALVYNIALCDSVAKSAKNSAFPRAVIDAAISRMAMAERFASAGVVARAPVAVGAGAPVKKA